MVYRYVTLLILVILLVAGFRTAHVASENESGWAFIVTQWQDAALNLVGLGHKSIGHSAPTEQARFWLRETNRVIDEYPRSASLAMGAAWILDSPDIGFFEDHIQQSDFAQVLPQMGLELDEEAISEAKAEFRDKCLESCLEMARRSTQLDPTDVRWWRMRALLLFEGDTLYSGQEFKPRENDWLEILEECKRHDPDNSLYDYLAALQHWNASASYDWPIESNDQSASEEWVEGTFEENADNGPLDETDEKNEYWILSVQDANGFAEGQQRFVEAQKKPFLAIGEAGYSSIAKFLAKSRLRKTDQAEVAVSRLVTLRHSTLFHRLYRWQNVRADNARRTNDKEQEMALLRQNLRLFDQAITSEETSALNTLSTFGILRRSTYEAILELSETGPSIIAPVQLDTIRQREEELRVEASTLHLALQTLDDESYPEEYSASWSAVFSGVTSTSAALLLFAGGVFLLFAKGLTRSIDATPAFGILRHAIAWIFGCGLTFLVLGMAPAEMISHKVQRVSIVTCIWVVAFFITALAVWFVIKLLRLRKIRFRLITLFAVMTGVAVLSSLWPLMEASFDGVAQFPPELWLHAKGWNGIDAEVLRTAMKLEKGTWYLALMQWFSHNGLYIGLVASLMLTSGWFMLRIARKANQRFLNFWTKEIKLRWAMLFSFLGHSAFAAAVFWVFLYLCVAPKAIKLVEAEYQHKMRYCRDPIAHWTEIRNAQAEVVESVEDMKTIRETVQFGLFGEGVLEKDFSQESDRAYDASE